LRSEAATNNVTDYGVKKAVEHLPALREELSAIEDSYLDIHSRTRRRATGTTTGAVTPSPPPSWRIEDTPLDRRGLRPRKRGASVGAKGRGCQYEISRLGGDALKAVTDAAAPRSRASERLAWPLLPRCDPASDAM
jgi:hypothetical protein